MKLTYHRCGDYLLPDLTIPDEPVVLGKYSRMRKTYLKEHKPILYNVLLLSGKLTAHLVGVDAECRERLETLLPQMMRHTLRHTFCTTLANAGMNPKALQYIMGHSNINMTLNYYAHTTSETSITEMKRLIA